MSKKTVRFQITDERGDMEVGLLPTLTVFIDAGRWVAVDQDGLAGPSHEDQHGAILAWLGRRLGVDEP